MCAIRASLAAFALAFAFVSGSACLAAPALETRVAQDSAESPPASAHALDWLVGSWSGPGVGGVLALETWTAPVGGTMVGTFIQQDADGAIAFTELMYIRPVGDSLELAIKHFGPDLAGWEEKEEVQRFRLIALEPCAAYFQALTIRCSQPDAPGKGLVIAARTGQDSAGAVRELVFRYGPR